MRKIIVTLLACAVSLSGCAATFTGIYWIKSSAPEPSSSTKLQQAIAVRDAFTRAAKEVGFSVFESGAKSADSVLPGLVAAIPRGGLKEPFKAMDGGTAKVVFSATFIYPYSIAIRDETNTKESELVRKIRQLMEDELAKVRPSVVVTFRVDKVRLD